MSQVTEEELILLGGAILAAQRVEFVLYGIAAHVNHIPAAQKERRFRELTPEKFLRGDISELKATLGQIATTFGDAFLIGTDDLEAFYKDRNFIAHNYLRAFHANIRGQETRSDGPQFLRDFVERATHWEAVVRGLLATLQKAAAEKERRFAEVNLSSADLRNIEAFHRQVAKFFAVDVNATRE